jgi:ABC-type transporter Mla maintaining outer membrane lipid asymmetry ATPase subunit MlaF
MSLFNVRNLCLEFADTKLFTQLDLSLDAGQSICIETGVLDGASSLLKCFAGIYAPASGEVLMDSQSVHDMPDKLRFRSVAYCYELGGLISTFTNYNNIAFPLLYSGELKAKEISQRIYELASALQLTNILHKEPHQLNDVQTRLMNLLRALCIRPRLMLIDEIQAGMSFEILENCLDIIKRQQQETGFALIMTTSAGDETNFADGMWAIENKRLVSTR